MENQGVTKGKVILLSQQPTLCYDKVANFIANQQYSQYELLVLNTVDELHFFLSNPFSGFVAIYIEKPDIDFLKIAVSARENFNPLVPLVVLLDGEATNIDVKELIRLNVSDVVDFNNPVVLNAVFSKYLLNPINPESVIKYAGYSSFHLHISNIHDNFPFGIVRVVINPSVYVDYINKEAKRLTGYSFEQYQSNPELRNLFLPDERIKLVLENADTGQEYLRKEIKFDSASGHAQWVEAIYIPGFYSNSAYKSIEVLLRDITNEKIDKVLQKAVYDIARMTSTNFSLNRIFTIIHKIIADIVSIDNFYIALFDESTQMVTFPYYVDIKDSQPPKLRSDGHGLTEYVIRTGKTLLCKPDCFNSLLLQKEIEIIGTQPKSWLGVPLKYHDKVLGVLAVQHYTNPEAFTEREQYILEFFSKQIAHTIDFKRKNDTIKLLSTAVEQSPVSIVITTLKPEIVYVNSTFTQVTGYEPGEVLGKNPNLLQSGLTPKERYVELWDTITSGKTWHGEFINRRKNGEIFYEESTITPITDELGKISFYLSVKIDITEKKKLINDLLAAKEKAEESDRLKTAFLQNISHEIRTPMNAIVGFAEILETDHDNEEKISYYTSVIKQRSFDLLDIINELLDISRIESGQLKAELKPLDVQGIFNDLLATFIGYKERMERQSIELKVLPLPENVSRIIISDEVKLRQIFQNLIHNALKFTHEGYVEFGFHELSNGSIIFRVTDTGIGIHPSMQSKIFERFQKINPDGFIYDGLGLGLSIVQSLINLIEGKIWLESEQGKGTTFYFSIPYKPQIQTGDYEPERPSTADLKGIKLLIVEDDAFNVAYFNELFTNMGAEFHVEVTGTDAIEHFKEYQNYDMVLMDIKLPDMTGYEVIERFRQINPKVPIVAQTAYASESDREKTLKAGCVGFISKPIFREKLIELLHKTLVS